MFYETADHHGLKRDPFKALVVPRPIGWISTLGASGQANLAPFSFFNAVASDPPVVIFSAGGPHLEGGPKDTPRNAEATGEFVCNLATWDLREAVNRTSSEVGREVDEFALAGLTAIASRLVKPPRVKESPVHLECRYLQTVVLPSRGHDSFVVFGEVVGIHIDDSILTDGLIDWQKFKPIARLGYMDYTVVKDVFTMPRPD